MTWLSHNLGWVGTLALSHLGIAVPAILATLLVSLPLGWVAHRHRGLGGPLLSGLGVLYAIPSLPLLVVVPALVGTGLRSPVNMVVVLTVYGVAVLVRQVAQAFDAVPADVVRSAEAAGFTPAQRLWRIELPLAVPVIAAGMRVVVVSTISLVTVGAVIGVQSLGTLFTDGFQRGIVAEVATGLLATLALALVLDSATVLIARLLTPWTRARAGAAS